MMGKANLVSTGKGKTYYRNRDDFGQFQDQKQPEIGLKFMKYSTFSNFPEGG